MKKLSYLFLMSLFVTGITIGSALAMDLNSAKHSGLIGEMPNGLIDTILPNPSAELSALVRTTNAGRMDVYKDAAAKQNIPLREVQAIAAQKMYDLASPGDYLMVGGTWSKK